MLRVDAAGNISKRFAGETFPFSRFGGTCPRWNLHAAFQTPGRVVTQIVETPDGQRFFTISRTVERPIRLDPREDSQLAIGLGCDVRYAPGSPMPTASTSPTRRRRRSARPARSARGCTAPTARRRRPGRTLAVNENRKTISPYPFLPS